MNFEKGQIQVFAAVAVWVALALYLLTGWKSFEIFNFICFPLQPQQTYSVHNEYHKQRNRFDIIITYDAFHRLLSLLFWHIVLQESIKKLGKLTRMGWDGFDPVGVLKLLLTDSYWLMC